MVLSPDSQTLLLLCSHLALPAENELTSLTLREWNPLARKLQALNLRPGTMLGWSTPDFQTQFALSIDESTRLARDVRE